MELRELRVFVAVAEEGGMSAAARRLHVSQSALSQTVTALERQLGVKLLVRSSSGVRTTEAGRYCSPRHVPSSPATTRPCGPWPP
jgi:DNA-binding transcriptional LysR family regulator